VAAAATGEIAPPSAPNSAGAFDCDGILRAATIAPTGSKCVQRRCIPRHCIVLKVAADDGLQPFAVLRSGSCMRFLNSALMAWSLARIFFPPPSAGQ